MIYLDMFYMQGVVQYQRLYGEHLISVLYSGQDKHIRWIQRNNYDKKLFFWIYVTDNEILHEFMLIE
jgi:hypothetical protein